MRVQFKKNAQYNAPKLILQHFSFKEKFGMFEVIRMRKGDI